MHASLHAYTRTCMLACNDCLLVAGIGQKTRERERDLRMLSIKYTVQYVHISNIVREYKIHILS